MARREPAPPAGRRAGRRLGRWLGLVAVTAVLAAGCGFASGMLRTANALREAGIDNPDITGGDARVTVTYDTHASESDLPAEQDRVAEVIWRNLPFRFSELAVTPRGATSPPGGTRTYSREELMARLGPRPSSLDNTGRDVEASVRATVRNVVIGLIAGGIVLLALVTLIIVLLVRASRRARPPVPVPAAGGWGPAAPDGRGWGQQPPPSGPGQPPPPGPGQRPPAPGWGQRPPAPPER
jgi:hypothetical protein